MLSPALLAVKIHGKKSKGSVFIPILCYDKWELENAAFLQSNDSLINLS